jgi:hypothetical protein
MPWRIEVILGIDEKQVDFSGLLRRSARSVLPRAVNDLRNGL